MQLSFKDLAVIGPPQAASDGQCVTYIPFACEEHNTQSCQCMFLRLQSCKCANHASVLIACMQIADWPSADF